MPRKGSRKVRSGCLTCKARKVKCDETKPQCKRCMMGGRLCQGLAFHQNHLSQIRLYRPRNHVLGAVSRDESRAIEFFCRVAAPSLSGPFDPYFWTHVVVQFSEHEPAIRHSIMTISSLFENLRSRYGSSPGTSRQGNIFAIKHYNAAIRELQKPCDPDLVLALMACIMFICIEILQSNAKVAFRHLYHGVNLLNTSDPPVWASYHLIPIFRRLSILPCCFGELQLPIKYSTQFNLTIGSSFSSLLQAQISIDAICSLTMQLFRQTGEYRLGQFKNQPIKPGVLSAQHEISQYLAQWRSAFDEFELKTPKDIPKTSRIWLFQQYEICTILSRVSYTTSETDYDLYIPIFKRMVRTAREYAGLRPRSATSAFHFEIGFSPVLFFIAIKCRCFKTRVEALGLLGILGASQESLWDSHILQAIAQRIIDLEHGITTQTAESPPIQDNSLPPDESRVRHFALEPLKQGCLEGHMAYRKITLYVLSKTGDICMRSESLKTR